MTPTLCKIVAGLALVLGIPSPAFCQAYSGGQFHSGVALKASDLNTAFANYLPLVGGTMQGPLQLQTDPSTSMQAATKQYVDAHVGSGGGSGTMGAQNANAVAITGGTITGLTGFGVNNTSTVTMAGGSPNWASLTTSYDNVRVTLGTCPQTQDFGGNTVGLASALVGCVSVPSTLTTPDASFGIVGYGDSASAQHGSVGVGGFSNTDADNGQSWGGNFLASNCKQRLCTGGNDGTTNATLYGAEIDINVDKTSTGSTPNALVRGLWITGASTTASSNPDLSAIEIGPMGINVTPHIPFPVGITFQDAAATNAIIIGTTATGNSVGSQPIALNSRNASGTAQQTTISTDLSNNLNIAGAASVSVPGPLKLPVKTVATLATCNASLSGAVSSVSDATSPTFLGTLTGGGAVHTPVFCNGTAWVAG